jgi:hypothetical protein
MTAKKVHTLAKHSEMNNSMHLLSTHDSKRPCIHLLSTKVQQWKVHALAEYTCTHDSKRLCMHLLSAGTSKRDGVCTCWVLYDSKRRCMLVLIPGDKGLPVTQGTWVTAPTRLALSPGSSTSKGRQVYRPVTSIGIHRTA